MITSEYINRAIDYILNHINENISVDDIASYCHFSRFYFSRMFKLETGESVYEFIMRVKMEQSAFRLKVEKDRSITDVSLDYGYSPSNYSSAFKQYHDISPTEFRRCILEKSFIHPFDHDISVDLETYEKVSEKVTIEHLSDITVIYERHKGNYLDLSEDWCKFQEKYSQLITEHTLFIERTYDDPSITNQDDCLYDLCMTVPEGYSSSSMYVITGGKFAVYHFKGSVEQIYIDYQNFLIVWFIQRKCEIDERYGFEIYREIDCNSMMMEIDFYIPIK